MVPPCTMIVGVFGMHLRKIWTELDENPKDVSLMVAFKVNVYIWFNTKGIEYALISNLGVVNIAAGSWERATPGVMVH